MPKDKYVTPLPPNHHMSVHFTGYLKPDIYHIKITGILGVKIPGILSIKIPGIKYPVKWPDMYIGAKNRFLA